MKKLNKVLKEKKNILSVYFTAGYPNLNDTTQIISDLRKFGADIIEVGIPYSDPLADGETIQNSSSIAIQNGINLDIVFEQLNSIKKETEIPLIIMGYLNQMTVYGVEDFLSACNNVGIQALIIPDLPPEEYEDRYRKLFQQYELDNIFLVTPETSEERIRKIDDMSKSFIYLVSTSSVTGARNSVSAEQRAYFERINSMNLTSPTLIGFGISDKKTFDIACSYSSGAITGSAFIKAISEPGELSENIRQFIKSLKN